MEQSDDKNYVKIMGKTDEPKEIKKNKTVIHTMPKRYMASLPAASHAKSTGILILILGFLFLIVALLVLYFYVLKKEPIVEITQTNNPDIEKEINKKNNTASTTEKTQNNNQDKEVLTDDNNVGAQASSTDNKKEIRHIDTRNTQNKQYVEANDSDKDGLSDLEELLLGSSPNSDDTDGDTFLDQTEVLKLYDPASKGILLDSLNIEQYNNEEYNFSILVSSLWTVEPVSGNDSLIVSLGKDQYIQIMSQNISSEQSIDDWYKDLFEVDEILDEQIYKRGNWNGIINESSLTVYLEHPNKKYIITLNYELGNDRTLYYKNIFDMMLQSIAIIE